jgi:hypothetical protein
MEDLPCQLLDVGPTTLAGAAALLRYAIMRSRRAATLGRSTCSTILTMKTIAEKAGRFTCAAISPTPSIGSPTAVT